MKDMHVESGHEWTLQLQRLTASADRSVTRGRKPVKHCPSDDFVQIASTTDLGNTVYGNTALDIAICAAMCVLRETEVEA